MKKLNYLGKEWQRNNNIKDIVWMNRIGYKLNIGFLNSEIVETYVSIRNNGQGI